MKDMLEVAFALGKWQGQSESILDHHHTCKDNRLMYPWPPSQDCTACKRQVAKFVRTENLEIPYLLFGWDAIVHLFDEALKKKIAQRDANRQKGAFI